MSVAVSAWVARPGAENIAIQPIALPAEVDSLDEATDCLPGGAYTTLRTYQGDKILMLAEQIKRLEGSARLMGKLLQIDEARLRQALRKVIAANQPVEVRPGGDLRLRLTLDLEAQPGDLYITAEALQTPSPADYHRGVAVITTTLERLLPEAKLTRFIARSRPLRQSLPEGINEAVMVNAQGDLLEGLTSNFFTVRQGEIYTAEKGVLAGITRALALESTGRARIPVHLQAVPVEELEACQEAFITSSSRGVLPVCRVDALQIGAGKPGPLTRSLRRVYEGLIFELVERI